MAKTNVDIEKFFAILASLQAYAKIEFLGDGLTGIGPGMKDKLMIDLFRIGALFELSKKEITTLVLRETFQASPNQGSIGSDFRQWLNDNPI